MVSLGPRRDFGFTKQTGGNAASKAGVDQQLWCKGRASRPRGEEHIYVLTA